ncbi:MAG: sigma-54-dependent Fis family transcriptional regulator [Ignavibacteria bacterium]|nr:sigma-54-dependent Fis family transcriptional regulator [Ignavibacteria bacterium]MBI3766616.1 sigma-54-dependent Fis family transcriptional regulator [Ignavibacteriales bacterium]
MIGRGRVLVVDDEPNILKTLTIGLEAASFTVEGFLNPCDALEHLVDGTYDIAFIDLMMQPIDGMQVLRELRQKSPSTTAVIITAHGSIDSAVEAIKQGAFDFLQKPFDLKELQLFAEKVFEHHTMQEEIRTLREQLAKSQPDTTILTRNLVMRQQIDLARQIADSPLTVLVEGESGTGKEMVAQFIHSQSSRRDQPLMKVNCAALAENLLESELFGHVKGAFTGAFKDRKGRFEMADSGTIFLDEVGEIAPSSQVKLLRFLQDREFERVGENVTRRVDVRVIAATNRKLSDSLREGSFREDLYYRLNAVRISLPPLRERPEDILLLMSHFMKKFSPNADIGLSPDAMKLLTSYQWPGNVRELENVMERAVLLAKHGTIESSHLPPELQDPGVATAGLLSLEAMERQHIVRVLRVVKDLDEASRLLDIDPATLWRKRKKYGITD